MKESFYRFYFYFFLVFSQSHHKVRLYDIIRKSTNKNTGTLLFEVRPHRVVLETATTTTTTSSLVNEQSQSHEDYIKLDPRDSWDSGEEHYFKWAALNRRPMESLAGRKRSIKKLKHH